MSAEKIFLDTNILVYAADRHAPKKQTLCRDLIRRLALEDRAVLSTQVLQEFFVVAIRKLGIAPLDAKKLLMSFQNMEVVTISPDDVLDAVDCTVLDQISLWDALIIIGARAAACDKIATEALNDGQVIQGVKIWNPL